MGQTHNLFGSGEGENIDIWGGNKVDVVLTFLSDLNLLHLLYYNSRQTDRQIDTAVLFVNTTNKERCFGFVQPKTTNILPC